MVERVAQRIWDRYPWPQDYPTDEGIPPYFLDAARAAMEAMREPSEEMVAAADVAMTAWRRTLSRDEAMARSYQAHDRKFIASATPEEKHAIRWRAMIDTALAEGTEAAQVDTTPLGRTKTTA